MLQFICAFLAAAGCLFAAIELRGRFDRSFLFFGASLVFLSAVVSLDLWIRPASDSAQRWIRALQIASAFASVTATHVMLAKLKRAGRSERRTLPFHLAGTAILAACGILEGAALADPARGLFQGALTLGVLAYGIAASLIFAERFLALVRDRERTIRKLETAYRDLEQVNALKQLGESTAIINHEIKNYMFMIGGNAQILAEVEPLSERGRSIVKNIVTSVERLADFSDDILRLSRTQVIKEKHPINLSQLLRGTIEKHYPHAAGRFTLAGCEHERFMFGDWGKLEQVFVNLFNNAFEAGGGEIRVKVAATATLLLVAVEDNGAGCGQAQLESLFRAFYTTRKSHGGTGLGMSIARTIVESHGGKISAYSKNLARKGEHGLKLIMTFPLYGSGPADGPGRKHPIVLIKEGMDNLPDLIRVFQNVQVTPHVLQNAASLNSADFPPETHTVMVGAKALASRFPKLLEYPRLCLVSHHEHNLYVLDHGRGNRPEVFSEEYVISRLLPRSAPRTRLRERQHLTA